MMPTQSQNFKVERFQGNSAKICAATIVHSAVSDVVIARYEDWLRRAGGNEPDSWLDRIDTAIDSVSKSTDALLALGRGHPAAKADNVSGLSLIHI